MAYDDMWEEVTDGTLLNKDHVIDATLTNTVVKAYGTGNTFVVITSGSHVDTIFPAGCEILIQTNATAGEQEVQFEEIGYDTDADVFKDTGTAAHNAILLRALKWDISATKWYVQNPSGEDPDGNKGWIEVSECAVIVAGPIVMKGVTTTSTWSAAMVGGVSTA